MIDPAARARLDRWKLSLLDLSTGNRLLDASRARTSIPVPEVDVVRLAAALAAEAAFSFETAEAGEAAGP
ncbi:MAG TPA: hypothetical protein VN253_13880, partial [Kofleriaceae bacterium]|nr:hypothetical protein [Kofleriaceae bacterium]